MKEYNKLQPEVIVGIGQNTEFEENKPPYKTVIKLQITLEDWLGDDLMECYPCYIVTQRLKDKLEINNKLTGFKFSDMEVIKDEYFDDNYQLSRPIEKFYWMKIVGKKNINDVFIGDSYSLYASKEFINFLRANATINYLEIDSEKNEFDDLLDKMIADSQGNNNKQDDFHSLSNKKTVESYKTHQGKTYTQEEWEAYEQQQWNKHNKDKK